jgi:EAL domain-containing protein (putative c-di-GMP-specific phosphodiesterase class I)
MVLAIAQIIQKPGIKTIAEFVENEETLLLLGGYVVDFAQGYYIEKPHPLSDL